MACLGDRKAFAVFVQPPGGHLGSMPPSLVPEVDHLSPWCAGEGVFDFVVVQPWRTLFPSGTAPAGKWARMSAW